MKQPRSYVLGLSIGTFWLIAASTGFSTSLLARVGTSNSRRALIAIGIAAVAYLAVSLRQIIVAARTLPKEPRTEERRALSRRFVWIVILEVVGIVVINTACLYLGLLTWFVPVDLIIVGLHFVPLAKLFGVPRYTALGVAFCAIPILTLIVVPADALIGSAVARYLISSLGCAAATWLTAAGNVLEIRQHLSAAP